VTVAEDPSESTAHLRDAADYLEDAEVAYAAGRFKPCASNACISTIRSSDAMCAAELGERWTGKHHGGATGLLRRTSLGDRGAELLGAATEAKNVPRYRTVETTDAEALTLLEGARELHGLSRSVVKRAGYPVP
jgi:hypothetical protein